MAALTHAYATVSCLSSLPQDGLTQLHDYKHLAAQRRGTGYAVIFGGRQNADLTEEVYRELQLEVAKAGLKKVVVFSQYNLVLTDDVAWQQFPADIMRMLSMSPAEAALVDILEHCSGAKPLPPTQIRLIDASEIEKIIAAHTESDR